MNVVNKFNSIKKAIAINEVSILRQSRQTSSLMVKNGKKVIIKKLVSDGVLVSTPAGSTHLQFICKWTNIESLFKKIINSTN